MKEEGKVRNLHRTDIPKICVWIYSARFLSELMEITIECINAHSFVIRQILSHPAAYGQLIHSKALPPIITTDFSDLWGYLLWCQTYMALQRTFSVTFPSFFPILLFSSISFQLSLRKAFLSLLAILCNYVCKYAMHSNGYIFPFLLCFWLLFFSQLFVRSPQTAMLIFAFLFPGDVLAPCLPYNVTNLCP